MKKNPPPFTLQMVPLEPSAPAEAWDGDVEILSFESLRQVMRQAADTPPEEPLAEQPNEPDESNDSIVEPVEMSVREVPLSPQVLLEAMLFVGDRDNRPLTLDRAAEMMRNVTVDDLRQAAAELEASYRAASAPYTVVERSGGFRLELRSAYEPLRAKFYGKVREATLSQKAIDVLAVVAYRQPVAGDDVDKLRKEASATILGQLARRGLVEQTKEKRQGKRVVVYRTTERFLKLFGLQSLDDLPQADEINFR